ncbi:hypothetical protein D9M69_509170 [compost metagenome]
MDSFCERTGKEESGSAIPNAEAQTQCVTPWVEMLWKPEIQVIDGSATDGEGHVVHLCGTAKLYSSSHTPRIFSIESGGFSARNERR